ncbi:hypothetical protein M0R45_014163 [Rubus argutus]|uniref:Tr-type G domain-containing protein n=1 Tax=Rubus argutus TaxID=59490 RepID=A0AAW1XLU6_RUBAR
MADSNHQPESTPPPPETRKLRNICILAHVDHGKTTLCDHLISGSDSGIIHPQTRRPAPVHGPPLLEEQRRAITMKSSSIALNYRDHSITGVHIQTQRRFCASAWIEKLTPWFGEAYNRLLRIVYEVNNIVSALNPSSTWSDVDAILSGAVRQR